jgi:hypothetical protein
LADVIKREKESFVKMIKIFCRKNHGSSGELCCDCRELLGYVVQRVALCPFGAGKPTCAKCPIHCFRGDMRARIITVMRYAGPRMLYRHPLLAAFHIFDSFKKPRNQKNG